MCSALASGATAPGFAQVYQQWSAGPGAGATCTTSMLVELSVDENGQPPHDLLNQVILEHGAVAVLTTYTYVTSMLVKLMVNENG